MINTVTMFNKQWLTCPALRKKFLYGLVRGYCAVKEYALLKEIILGLQGSFIFFFNGGETRIFSFL